MSTSTSTSARRTGTDDTRRTTVRPRCQARASATRSGNDAPAIGTGGSAVGRSAASRATVVIPAARSAVAASPRTTRLTSCSRASSASQVGHHGQRRHSMTRDGRASAGAPVAAAVATATRSAKRASYSASVLRWPGQCSAARSCQTTTSASSPTTPPCRPKGSPGARRPAGVLQHPVQVGQAHQVARLGAGLARRVRDGLPGVRLGQGRGEGAAARVRDAVPHDDHRHVPAAGQAHEQLRATPSSAARRPGTTAHPRRARRGGRDRPGQDRTPDSGAPAATAAAVAATRSGASADTACHPAPATRPSCAPIRTRCSAASASRCADDGSGSACGPATADGSWSRWIRRRQCVVAEASSTTPAGPAPGACAGTWSAVAVTVPSVVTTTDSSRAAPADPRTGPPRPHRHLCRRESARSTAGSLPHPVQVVARRLRLSHPAQQVRRSHTLCDGEKSISSSARGRQSTRAPARPKGNDQG